MRASAKTSVAQYRPLSSSPPSCRSRTANTGTTASRSTVSAFGRLTSFADDGGGAAGAGGGSGPGGGGRGRGDVGHGGPQPAGASAAGTDARATRSTPSVPTISAASS